MNLFHDRRAEPAPKDRRRSRGQVIVMFAGAMLAFMGLMAIVIDVSWYWANTLRVQRAADAAALAGVVWLPNLYSSADTTARAEAKKNGYEAGVNGTTITTAKDPTNDRKLIVTISAPVPSFFARVIGIASFPVSRTSKAEFILPVAMGSPENYYGVFGKIKDATFTGPVTSDTTFKAPTAVTATSMCSPACNWSSTNTLFNKTTANGTTYASSSTTSGSQQAWGGFAFGVPAGAAINGLEVRVVAKLDAASVAAGCTIGVQVNPNGGATWYPVPAVVTTSLTLSNVTYTFGTQASTSPWTTHTWVSSDFGSSTTTGFMTRLTWNRGSCSSSRFAKVDTLNVRVTYTQTVTSAPADKDLRAPSSACANGVSDCFQPDGAALNYRGFWATMNTEGAANINGDAFQPYYDVPTSTVAPPCPTSQIRACYDSFNYYNYGIEMAPGSSNGYVYVFDPGFCFTAVNSGTGDRWFGGNNAVSSFYEIYDTNNTPYNLLDDTLIKSSGTKFANIAASDTTMGGSGGSECKQTSTAYGDGRDYHNQWVLLNPSNPLTGGPNGTLYRLHTTGTDPANASAQRSTNGEQTFAIYASASGTTPKIYGLGAMQMFSPLEVAAGASAFSEFYIAQVPAAHAGKTLELSLWDPGDTNQLSANIQIEIPTAAGWSPVTMTWYSVTGTSGSPQNCSSYAQGQTGTQITTNAGGGSTGVYNGCWLTIDVTIPSNYTAQQSGWWKIRYNMVNPTGSTSTSFDVTTWTAKIRGNPVHLVLP